MASIRDYRTYGALISAVQERLVAAAKRAKLRHYGTPQYFREAAKEIHREFDAFAGEGGATPDETARLREAIAKHLGLHPMMGSVELHTLTMQVPPEFCVRGVWVSPRADLVVH